MWVGGWVGGWGWCYLIRDAKGEVNQPRIRWSDLMKGERVLDPETRGRQSGDQGIAAWRSGG